MVANLNKNKMSDIFAYLKEGRFLSENDPNKTNKLLFNYVENHIEEIKDYFSYIGIDLKLKNGYCYFATTSDIKSKLATIYELLDMVSFLFDYNVSFGVGERIDINSMIKVVQDNITLKRKLDNIKSISSDTLSSTILTLVTKLEKRGFVALEDEYNQRYIVLNSFDYLIDFFNKIEIID